MVFRKGFAGLSLVLGVLIIAGLAGNAAAGPQVAAGQRVDYSGYAMVRVETTTQAQLEALDAMGINLACREMAGWQPMVIQRSRLPQLDAMGLNYAVVADNAQAVIDQRAEENRIAREQRDATFYTAYRDITEISDEIDALVALNPAIASRFVVGQSLEGRDIFGIRICGAPVPDDAPAFVINGTQHAREWLGTMAVCYTAEQLITQYGVDSHLTELVDSIDWYIIPVANPDGFVYTWGPDRYWRKNRRDNGNGTFGVDPNRNWDSHWGGIGSSGSTSDETYRGPAPFSEPETANLSAFIASIAGTPQCINDCSEGNLCSRLKAHLDIHTFSALILGPWAWNDQIVPPRETELRSVQEAMQDAMNSTNGYSYVAGLGSDQLLYIADGVCPDWTFQHYGALSWTYELRPASGGLSGFSPPASEIGPATTETFAGVLVLADHIKTIGLTLDVLEAPATLVVGEGGGLVRATADVAGTCGQNVTDVTLYWRLQGAGSFNTIPMTDTGPDWEATIPEQACGETVEFYVEATDTNADMTSFPADAPTTLLTANAINILLSRDDDFEADTGWTVGAPDDTATSGIWARMAPQATTSSGFVVQPGTDYSPDGTLCWVTDGNAGASAGVNDVDGGKTTLFSPVLDLAATTNAEVSFEAWYSNNAGAAPGTDTFRIDITNDGTNWVNAVTIGPSGLEAQGGWNHYAFQAEDFVTLNSTVQVRFVADDAGTGSLVEALVDEFMVRESQPCTPPPSCIADLDADNDTDVFDFGTFLANFGASVTPGTNGDFDSSGTVDVFDFATFASDFGCGT